MVDQFLILLSPSNNALKFKPEPNDIISNAFNAINLSCSSRFTTVNSSSNGIIIECPLWNHELD
ncbi:hypothetical protein HanRHA438_Chr11g0506281 [Helianthus annuus]|nr:hypothetical protein HanRHA438_Chr11g0506281 [Helianthus annuus]